MQLRRATIGISKARSTEIDLSAGKEVMEEDIVAKRKISIGLEAFTLDIRKRELGFWRVRNLSILKSVEANFGPGMMNVIMG